MGEQSFVNLEQSLLVVDKEVQQVVPIFLGEVYQPHTALSQLSESQKRLFKILSLLDRLVHVMELFACVNFILKSTAHDLLPDFFDTLNEQRLKIVALKSSVRLLRGCLTRVLFFFLQEIFQVPDQVIVVGLERLHVLYDMIFNIDSCHFRLKYFRHKFLKFHVARWYHRVVRLNRVDTTRRADRILLLGNHRNDTRDLTIEQTLLMVDSARCR